MNAHNTTLDEFSSFFRSNTPDEIASPIPNTELLQINQALLTSLYYTAKKDAETAARQYNVSIPVAKAIAASELSDLASLASSTTLLFKPACDDQLFISVLKNKSKQHPLQAVRFLANHFSSQNVCAG